MKFKSLKLLRNSFLEVLVDQNFVLSELPNLNFRNLKQHLPTVNFLAKARLIDHLHCELSPPFSYSCLIKLNFLARFELVQKFVVFHLLIVSPSSSVLRMVNVGKCHLPIKVFFYVEGNKSIFCIINKILVYLS